MKFFGLHGFGTQRPGGRRLVPALLAIMALPLAAPTEAHAQGSDKFKVSLGGYSVFRYDSTMSLTQTDAGVGVSFTPEDTLGWDGQQTVARLDGRYRFNDTHALTVSWYSIGLDGSRALDRDIEWVDVNGDTITIPAGTGVSSGLNYDIYKVGYLWSFYHNDKVELSVGAGLHVTNIDIGLTAQTTSSGVDARRADTTLPLPVLSFRMGYEVSEAWRWFLKTEVFALSFDNWTGTYSDIELGLEYRINRHLGAGLGIGSNSLRVKEESGATRFEYDNRLSGAFLFLTGYFE
jgi:hypothetical protein